MKKTIKRPVLFLPILLMLCSLQSIRSYGQAVGDYGSSGTMAWNGGTWNVCVTAGTWTGATTTTTAPLATNNVWILTGHTVTVDVAAGSCANLTKVGNLITVTDLTCTGNITGLGNHTGTGKIIMTGSGKYIDNSTINNLQINPGTGNIISTGAAAGATAFNVNGNLTITSGTFRLMGNLYYGTNGTVAVPTQLLIAAGATLTGNGTTSNRLFIQGSATVITNNGIMGQAAAYASNGGLFINTRGNVLVTVTGTGVCNIRGVVTDTFTTSCSIVIDQDMNLSSNTGALSISDWGQTYPVATDARSLTINAGKTVTLPFGWLHTNVATQTSNQTVNTYNINGTLVATVGGIGLVTTSSSSANNLGTTNSLTLNIGATGTVRCGQVIVNKLQSGQTINVNVATGGTIVYTGTSYTTDQGTGTTALLTTNNHNVQFTSAAATSIGLNNNFTVAGNLTLGGATTLSGVGNLSVNGTLSLSNKLTNNTGNLTLGSAATLSGISATNYIDLTSGGSLTRQAVSTSATLFPIGYGNYTPLTLTGTTSTPNITTKVKPTIDNAVGDATKIVNLQWSITGNNAATANAVFQFNTANQAGAFNVAGTCDLGNYTSTWSAVDVGVPAGINPYTVAATGINILTTNNLFVVGNTGQVVRNTPTTTNWTGTTDTDWAKAANWSDGLPDNTMNAFIPTGLSRYPVVAATQEVKDLKIQAGASLTNNGILKMYGANIVDSGTVSGNGMFTFNGSTAQTITGTFNVNYVTLSNGSGIVNNGVFTINNTLTIVAGALTGTAPIYASNLPILFSGSITSAAGLLLNPSAGNVGTLTINGTGTLNLSNAATVKKLILTQGNLYNSTNNITITDSLFRDNGSLSAGPVYNGNVPVTVTGSGNIPSSYEIIPATGSIGSFNLKGNGNYTVASNLVANGDINVSSGTLKMASNMIGYNIMVASGATITSDLPASSFSRRTLTVGNGVAGNDATMTINGTLGSATRWSTDGLDVEISANAKTMNLNGSGGTVGIACLRPAANADARTLDIFINQDITLNRDNGGAANIEPALTLQNGTGSFARTLTIATGATVTFRGNSGLHGVKNAASAADESINNYPSAAANQGNCTYIINGTMDLTFLGSTFNLNTCSFAGNTQSVIVNIKNGGVLKLANVVKLYTALAGQTSNILADDGSNVIFNFNGAQTILTSTGAGITPALSFYNLIINNSSNINLTNPITVKGTLTQTVGNITGNAVVMGGSAIQNIVANGNSIQTLTINNAAGVTGNPSVTGTLIITNGQLADYSSVSNCNVLFNGTAAQTLNGPTSINNLTINNSNGVALNVAPTINGILNMTAGKLMLGNSNLTIWTSGSIVANTPLASYIATNGTGNVKFSAQANTAFSLPIGTTISYNPVTLTPTTATDFYVNVANGNTPALTTIGGTLDVTKTLARTWNITATVPSSTTVAIGYLGTTDANAGFDNSGADVALLHKNSTDWEYAGTGSTTPFTGAFGYKYATFGSIGSFSPFSIANPGPGAVYIGGTSSSFSNIFKSAGTGFWGDATTWLLYDNASSTWGTTVATPTSTSTVTIIGGHTVTLNAQAGVGTLTIESGAKLNSATNATTSAPIVLLVGKVSSTIRNNGVFGCANGSASSVGGDGISIAIANNCSAFSLIGTGSTGIGSLYAVAGNNSLTAVIDQDAQFRFSSTSGLKTALSMADITDATFTGSRTLIVNAGRTVSFFNNTSSLHGTSFSAAGAYNAQQGNIVYDIQGILDLKGGNVYITSSTHASSSAQTVKLNVGTAGKVIVGGDFNIAKIQATQSVYVNIENGGLLDASASALTKTNFYGPSTNATAGYGANYVWAIMGGINATYKRLCGTGASTKTFNIAVPPASADYVSLVGNPVAIGTNHSLFADVYSVGVEVGNNPALYSYSPNYAINRTWKVTPNRTVNPYVVFLKFGFTGGSVDANAAYSPTYAAFTNWSGTTTPAGSTDLYTYNGASGKWANLSWQSNLSPIAGTLGTTWQINFNSTGGLVPPYKFTFLNTAAPLICY